MTIRVIKSEADYEAALARVEELMSARPGTPEGDELELRIKLIEDYEDKNYKISLPDPIAAIKFRMEQQGLKNRDLIKYIGSSAKVSEVLSGKRALTLPMIRAMSEHLGIPAEVLIQEPGGKIPEEVRGIDWSRFPLNELAKRGWIRIRENLKAHAEELMRELIDRAGGLNSIPQPAYRKNDNSRRNAKMDSYALSAWCIYVLAEARSRKLVSKYKRGSITIDFLRDVARLGRFANGPKRAQEFLSTNGIVLVLAKHLPKTYLDGAAMITKEGMPVVGMTIRYDRLDNFWFCLLHELAHLGRHMDGETDYFVDDLSLRTEDDNVIEKQADDWANKALIPEKIWENAPARIRPTVANVISLSQELEISPAAIAGRIRYERRDYHLLSQLVGNGEVSKHFAELKK